MANAPLPLDPQPGSDVPQGDMPGAFSSPMSRRRPATPSRTKTIAVLVGLGVLALIVVMMALRDDGPNPAGDTPRDTTVQPAP